MRLQSLLKKRAEILASTSSSSSPGDLLASIQTMDHCTTLVSFPGSSSSSSSSSTTVRDEEGEDTTTATSRGDNRLIAQALAKKVAAAAAADRDQDEGPPLTTSALREVWALEKARVYSTVLVRVRSVVSISPIVLVIPFLPYKSCLNFLSLSVAAVLYCTVL